MPVASLHGCCQNAQSVGVDAMQATIKCTLWRLAHGPCADPWGEADHPNDDRCMRCLWRRKRAHLAHFFEMSRRNAMQNDNLRALSQMRKQLRIWHEMRNGLSPMRSPAQAR